MPMSGLPFLKMHGLGNDFVVLDGRARPIAIGAQAARAIADRRTGVGCDQVLILEPPRNGTAAARLAIRNADGGEVSACGNGARCVASLLMKETGAPALLIETAAGPIAVYQQNAEPGATAHGRGDRVTLAWSPDATFVVADSQPEEEENPE